MKFKTEVLLLSAAIMLFVISVFFYSYHGATGGDSTLLSASLAYPYRGIALAFVGFGTLLTLTASVSYNRKTKI
ncbi:MAG: hypothetical protein NWE98_02600 [Candidatus Bathyarchaeota archaeon]|nr:hypothetical protein [Candidatus Bathyarchaeota archaeon]